MTGSHSHQSVVGDVFKYMYNPTKYRSAGVGKRHFIVQNNSKKSNSTSIEIRVTIGICDRTEDRSTKGFKY